MITIDYDNSSDALITEQRFGCTSWKEKEEAEPPQTDEPFRVQGIPMRGFIVRADDNQFPLYWEGRQGADLACNWLNSLWAEREKEAQKENEPMWSFDGKVIKFGPKRLCGMLFRKDDINRLIEFLNKVWDEQGLGW
jgi:hypothetical protein